MVMIDPSRVEMVLRNASAAQTNDPSAKLAVRTADNGRSKTFAELYRAPAIFDVMESNNINPSDVLARAALRGAVTKVGMNPGVADALMGAARQNGWNMQELLFKVSATPQPFIDVMSGSPNAPNPDAVMTWQWSGPAAPVAVPAGATVIATWQPAKGFSARTLAITAGTNATTDQDDLAVGSIQIGGVTQNNSGIVPSLIYRPTANTVPGVPNFSGPWVPPNTTISVTLVNTGADALSVLLGMGGPTG